MLPCTNSVSFAATLAVALKRQRLPSKARMKAEPCSYTSSKQYLKNEAVRDTKMRSPSTIGAHDLRKVLFAVVIASSICSAAARRWANVTCPELERCSCWPHAYGVNVVCKFQSVDGKFNADMAKLQGLFLAKMSMIYLNITELPASWFTNHIVYKLRVMHCGLRDAAAVCRINGLRYIIFSDNEMESVPECLSRANRLRTLLAPRNRMKRLRGTLVFPELQRMDFTRNGIETIDEGYFSGLPNLRYLRLSHNNIHKLLPNLFRKTISLVELLLNDNSIRSVQEVFNHLHRLEALDLSKNKICDIEKLARSTLPYFRHLKELRLTENCITLIPRFLSRNGGIRRLNLKDNSVTHIIAGAFEQLEELTAIDLSRNIISNLSDSYFAHHSILEDINLSRNNLTTVSTLFDRTRKIKTINLSFNRIADISFTFRGLTELRAVFLKSNNISSVSDGTFQDNVRLVKIDLSFNNIAWIGMDAFKGLVNVNILNLERNRILSLNFSLSGLPKLEYIDASYNAILTLESGEFQNNRHLIKVTLKENNITNVQGAFIAATGLLYLDLAGNQVKLLRRSDFAEETTNVPAITPSSATAEWLGLWKRTVTSRQEDPQCARNHGGLKGSQCACWNVNTS